MKLKNLIIHLKPFLPFMEGEVVGVSKWVPNVNAVQFQESVGFSVLGLPFNRWSVAVAEKIGA